MIQDDDHLLTVLRYIEANPLRARIVERAGDYPWSSFACHGLGCSDPLLDPLPGYDALASYPAARQRRWSAYVHHGARGGGVGGHSPQQRDGPALWRVRLGGPPLPATETRPDHSATRPTPQRCQSKEIVLTPLLPRGIQDVREQRRAGLAGRSCVVAGCGGRGVGDGLRGRGGASATTVNPGVATAWGLAYTSAAAPQTPSAEGNTLGAAAGLTSEKMKGADAVFGSKNVAVVVPVTDPWVAKYPWNGVSGGGGVGASADPAIDPLTGVIIPNRERLHPPGRPSDRKRPRGIRYHGCADSWILCCAPSLHLSGIHPRSTSSWT